MRIFRSSNSSWVGRRESRLISLAPIIFLSNFLSSSLTWYRMFLSINSCFPGLCCSFIERDSFLASFAANRSGKHYHELIAMFRVKILTLTFFLHTVIVSVENGTVFIIIFMRNVLLVFPEVWELGMTAIDPPDSTQTKTRWTTIMSLTVILGPTTQMGLFSIKYIWQSLLLQIFLSKFQIQVQ